MIKILFVLLSVENIYLCMSKSPRQKKKLKLKVTKRGKRRNTKGRRTRLSNNRKVTMKKRGGSGNTVGNAATGIAPNIQNITLERQIAIQGAIQAEQDANQNEKEFAESLRNIVNIATENETITTAKSSNIQNLAYLLFNNSYVIQGIKTFLEKRKDHNSTALDGLLLNSTQFGPMGLNSQSVAQIQPGERG